MEKEFQPKNLAGPGVGSSVVDTAHTVIYVTSVASHVSHEENSPAQKHSLVLGEKPWSWIERPKAPEAV